MITRNSRIAFSESKAEIYSDEEEPEVMHLLELQASMSKEIEEKHETND